MTCTCRFVAFFTVVVISSVLQLASATSFSTGEQLQSIVLPSNARVQWVSKQGIHNGHKLSIASYDSDWPIQLTLDFFKNSWAGSTNSNTPSFIVEEVGDWVFLSRLMHGFNTVIQLRKNSPEHSSGFLSVLAVSNRLNASELSAQTYGTRPLSLTHSEDELSSSTVVVLESPDSVSVFAERMLSELRRRDWSLTWRQVYGRSQVFLMSMNSRKLEMVITDGDSGNTVAVMNEVSFDD